MFGSFDVGFQNEKTMNLILKKVFKSIFIFVFVLVVIFNSVGFVNWFEPPNTSILDERIKVHLLLESEKETAAYCIFYNFTTAKNIRNLSDYVPITLSLHSTLNYAHLIQKQAKNWDDLISFAVFLNPGTENHLSSLLKLSFCDENVRNKVSIHLIWELGVFQSTCSDEAFKKSTEFFSICSETDVQNAVSDLKNVSIPLLAHYPINLMRNEARKGATTPLVIVADTENFFSKNFAINVRNLSQKLLETGHEKDVLIYRRFEMESSAKFPENLNETLQLFKNKKLFEFHSHVYREGHSIPNLDEWFNYGIANDVVTKTPIQFTRANWEPQFIFSTIGNPPFHNELVPTRFQDHQFFVNEICRAGYKFHLLSHVYNIHYGVKKRSSDVEKLLVTVARNPGQKLLKNFRNYLNEKYPDTKNSCPDFKA